MVGKELKDLGLAFKGEDVKIVHIALKKDEKIPAHNHKGKDIFFTTVKGKIELYLGEENETHIAECGNIIYFNGEENISATSLEDSEAFIYLIKKK